MAAARTRTADKADAPVVIKKYANRRLYNTARSSYVTLDDLAAMVRAGEDFAVYDAKTGEDITRSVLTQIIFEEEQKGRNMLPPNFLRQLIRLYGDALQSVVPGYLEASMEAFSKNQEQMREAFRANPAMANFEAMTRQNMELFQQTLRMFTPFPTGPRHEPGPPAEPAPEHQEEPRRGEDLDRLERQLREMQAQIERLSRDKG